MTKPVFIIGCPRSGTTILLYLLAAHEAFAWVSGQLNRFPQMMILLSYYNRIYDIPGFGKYLFLLAHNEKCRRILPRPVEPWRFWNTYLSNFQWERRGQIPPRRRTENDITPEEITNTRRVIQRLCKYQNRERFISKYTDFPRIKYLLQPFPDAQFIHILRDGRAVAHSYCTRIKSGDFGTWQEREWWVRGWPASWRKHWRQNYNSPLSLTAYQWKFFVKEIREDAKCLPSRQYLEVRYEDLMESPKKTLVHILEFCGLGFTTRVSRYLDRIGLRNMNYKWKKALDDEQQRELNELIVDDEFRRTFED